ncbi:TIGR02996 domain-containing protein [Gemmata sp. G18]|uniref:TIGR02996 domain-containing protein n=1 Tax=Gemmata palustris TaxID=2822762 RepID=A0ABS5C2S3_9BACT|nr:TIGR02996 domain-containing protein [Gemmata palustris]MBP3960277.1 TIGR02996 domain-containing protein [Gemmata palustris]
MHPEADAFLDAIFDHPDDDTPRLVYADWLQEHGQANYAQFIRLQCAAAREKLWSDEANRLWEEIGRVWNRLDEEWWPATREAFPGKGWWHRTLDAIHYRRGFLSEDSYLTYSQLTRYSDSCWPWLPLPFTTIYPDYEAEREILLLPRLNRIRHLRFAGWYDDHMIWPLIESPQLVNLESLDLSAGVLSVGEVEGMLNPGLFPQLRELRVRVIDESWYTQEVAGGSPSTELDQLRQRVEARFKKVVWQLTN